MRQWIVTTLRLLAVIWQAGASTLAALYQILRPYALAWLTWAVILTAIGIGTSVVFVGFGIFRGMTGEYQFTIWYFPLLALYNGAWVLGLYILWYPLAVIIGVAKSILQGVILNSLQEGFSAGERYLQTIWVAWLYLFLFTLFATALPFWTNPILIPAMITVSITLGLVAVVWGGTKWFKPLSYTFLVVFLVGIILSWILPQTATTIKGTLSEKADSSISQGVSQTGNAIADEGIIKGGGKMLLAALWKKKVTEVPITLEKGEREKGPVVPDDATVTFTSSEPFYILEFQGYKNGTEQWAPIEMPAGASSRYFTWGGPLHLQGGKQATTVVLKF